MAKAGSIDTVAEDGSHIVASGLWKTFAAGGLEKPVEEAEATIARGGGAVTIDATRIEAMDVAGAWLIHRLVKAAETAGRETRIVGLTRSRRVLLDEVSEHDRPPAPPRAEKPYLMRMLGDVGTTMIGAGRDLVELLGLLGYTVNALFRLIANPTRLRPIAVMHHLEHVGVRAIPIISLISAAIGAIIAQQGAFQLRQFGAETFSVNLVAILVLREVGLLITSIMVAGRSGSAFTAEIGSMKMREEIDAMRVLALDPIEVLVVPRVIALMIALPVLTVLSDFTALFGAGLVSWVYIDMPPEAYINYLRGAVAENTFWVGLIKAPFMALIIGLIACREGMNVGGSAESLGRQTTSAVVKSIFVVIILDGLFAMFFSAIKY
ncbi:MAG: ABC transporter permease [Flavobacteriaceae bacterium]